MHLALWIRVIPVALALLAGACATAQNPIYEFAAKEQKAEVTVLATSTSVHSGTSGNQDIYLADVRFKGNAHQTAKLVDAYPPINSPIQRSVLTERQLLRMTLTRNPECDSTGKSFFLAPGDSNIFDTSARRALHDQATERIPCFNVVHEATRLAK